MVPRSVFAGTLVLVIGGRSPEVKQNVDNCLLNHLDAIDKLFANLIQNVLLRTLDSLFRLRPVPYR